MNNSKKQLISDKLSENSNKINEKEKNLDAINSKILGLKKLRKNKNFQLNSKKYIQNEKEDFI